MVAHAYNPSSYLEGRDWEDQPVWTRKFARPPISTIKLGVDPSGAVGISRTFTRDPGPVLNKNVRPCLKKTITKAKMGLGYCSSGRGSA
jgi:hypothetical protein